MKTAAVTRAVARKATSVSPGKLPVAKLSKEVPGYELEDGDEPEVIDLTMLNTSGSDEDDEEEMKMVEIKMEL